MTGKRSVRQHSGILPPPSEEFWNEQDTREAIQYQNFGLLVRSYRRSFTPSISQLELSNALGVTQPHISKIESGRATVDDLGKMSRWARILGMPDHHLWFKFPVETGSEIPSKEAQGANVDSRTLEAAAPARATQKRPSLPTSVSSPNSKGLHHRLISANDVSALLATIQSFRELDNRFGGGHLRSAVVAHLTDEVDPMLRGGHFSRGARRNFQRASAELNQLAGWMAYDVGDEIDGRHYLRRALKISSEAGDDALSAEMLAAMSHQAAYAGRADEAIDFALGAARSSLRSGAPALQAESAVLEAQGHSIHKDVLQCLSALRKAERAFNSVSGLNTPPWLRYFDHAYMSAKFAHALREIGNLDEAENFARHSLQMCDGYDRGRLFNTALLAGILADQGRIDEAAASAQEAARMSRQVRSARAWHYLDGVRTQLYPHRKSAAILDRWPDIAAVQCPPSFREL